MGSESVHVGGYEQLGAADEGADGGGDGGSELVAPTGFAQREEAVPG